MSWPAPSPPRFAMAREDEAHSGAGPPCTFRYACTLPPPHEKKKGLRDVRRFPALSRVRTILCGIEEMRTANCATMNFYHTTRYALVTKSEG